MIDSVLYTFIGLALLKKKFEDKKQECSLVVKKGIKFIETETKMTEQEIEVKVGELASKL